MTRFVYDSRVIVIIPVVRSNIGFDTRYSFSVPMPFVNLAFHFPFVSAGLPSGNWFVSPSGAYNDTEPATLRDYRHAGRRVYVKLTSIKTTSPGPSIPVGVVNTTGAVKPLGFESILTMSLRARSYRFILFRLPVLFCLRFREGRVLRFVFVFTSVVVWRIVFREQRLLTDCHGKAPAGYFSRRAPDGLRQFYQKFLAIIGGSPLPSREGYFLRSFRAPLYCKYLRQNSRPFLPVQGLNVRLGVNFGVSPPVMMSIYRLGLTR